jgi:hypothetical protein
MYANADATLVCYSVHATQVGVGPQQLLIPKWQGGGVDVTNLRVSCEIPPIGSVGDLSAFMVDDAVGLMNAIVAAQNFSQLSQATIAIRQNITLSNLYDPHQPLRPQLPIAINLTIMAADVTVQTIIDWNLVLWVFSIYSPTVTLTFRSLFMMNISPVRGLVVPNMGYLPLLSVPFWAVW